MAKDSGFLRILRTQAVKTSVRTLGWQYWPKARMAKGPLKTSNLKPLVLTVTALATAAAAPATSRI